MKGLSKAQLSVLLLMYKKGYVMVNNEGANFKCWLEDQNGNKVPYVLNRNTGNCLHTDGWVDGDLSRDGGRRKFYSKLSQRAVNKLSYWYTFPKYQQEMDSLLRRAFGKIQGN